MGDLYTDEGAARQRAALAMRCPAWPALRQAHRRSRTAPTASARPFAHRAYGKCTAEADTPPGRATTRAGCEPSEYVSLAAPPAAGAAVVSGRK